MKITSVSKLTNKRINGRTICDCGINDEGLCLLWGASALEFNVKAREVWIRVSSEYDTYESWIAVEVNGYQISRFMAPKKEEWICVARNMNPEKENLISIIKDTQAMAGDNHHSLFIHEIGLNDEGEFVPVVPRKMKIEFIGDSITSGEGLAGLPDEMDWITQWFCASKTYAFKTAKAMNADWSMVSQCGWGLSWGWDANVNSNMPAHYENVCSLLNGEMHKNLGTKKPFDFGKGSDFVVLNLGTNDNSGLSADSSKNPETIYKDVISFLKLIRKENPCAKIIWTWGMISIDKVPAYIQKGIDDYKAETKDNNVYSLEFDSMDKVETKECHKGSRGHPGPRTHQLAAEKLIGFIKKLV